ncbi:adenosylcobinamide amidohydrolase CbiZ, partial [Halobacterium salinarum]|nr:adenosylcobinamide amidohydrolase CbiZ [Halobacterium salinarum]
NLVAATTRALDDAALSNLVAVAAEAKAATLLATAGFPGTTSDAVVVACDPGGETAPYSGSATPVGAATRACVREAVCASLDSRDAASPDSVESAAHGTTTDVQAAVSRPSPGWNG